MDTETGLPLIRRAIVHGQRPALIDESGKHSYNELLRVSEQIACSLLGDRADLGEARVAFMCPPSFDYVAAQWGIWRAGGVAVPLNPSYPAPEIEYILHDSDPEVVLTHPRFEKKLLPLVQARGSRLLPVSTSSPQTKGKSLPRLDLGRRAMILYTSGTTSRPKGVVTTHGNITAQVTSLVEAWEWTGDDHILNVLPLHHVHGIVNALLCPLWEGAICEFAPGFDPDWVWERLARCDLTLFMAVPTIYVKLLTAWEDAPPQERERRSGACDHLRLMVSGSAALPVTVFEKWSRATGHTLLERYGMTEIGMALSNPVQGERRPGFVGTPLPGVKVRVVDDNGREVKKERDSGEIQIQGTIVFREYWKQPEATRAAFRDGWFLTGDLAQIEDGYFRILGRKSVDIIKTGGYKVSALEVEEVLRSHPLVKDCAVVGAEDNQWGERVCAAVILEGGNSLALDRLRGWAKERLALHKIPSRLLVVDEMPRNAMGKVIKPKVKGLFKS